MDEAIGHFLVEQAETFDRLSRFMRALALEDANDVAAMTVALRKLRAITA